MIDKGRVAEGALIALVAGVIAAAAATWTTGQVLTERMNAQEEQMRELKEDIRELRRDFYLPRYPDTSSTPRGTPMPNVAITDLVSDLKDSLHSSAEFFNGTDADADADFKRHIDVAQRDLSAARPRIKVAELALQADVGDYANVPADLLETRSPLWGASKGIKPWDPGHPGTMPRLTILEDADGKKLNIAPAPTTDQIRVLGSTFRYYYTASLAVDADNLSLSGEQRDLLLLRAQAEAMRELAMQNANRPVQTRTSLAQSSNSTPGALHDGLMREYNHRVGRI